MESLGTRLVDETRITSGSFTSQSLLQLHNVQQWCGGGTRDQDTPFFMYIATPAPHRPATPAPQYSEVFAGKQAPRTPSYGVTGVDKHWLISKGESGWVLLYSSIVTHTHTIHPTLYRKFKYLILQSNITHVTLSSYPDTSQFIHSFIHSRCH